jgi:hypothetical protein
MPSMAARVRGIAGYGYAGDMGRFFDIYEPMHALVAEEGKALLGLAHYLF